MKIHFEIGTIRKEGSTETKSVFISKSLVNCIKEWKEKEYTFPKYFIDVWENEYPVAELDIKRTIF